MGKVAVIPSVLTVLVTMMFTALSSYSLHGVLPLNYTSHRSLSQNVTHGELHCYNVTQTRAMSRGQCHKGSVTVTSDTVTGIA